MRPGTGALPTAIASPTRSDNRRNLSPPHLSAPHFSASHFSAIPIFISFRLFLLSPKNHLSALSVSLKQEKNAKERDRHIPALCGSDPHRPGTGALPTAIASPMRWDHRGDLSPPHFSASHFSATDVSANDLSANDLYALLRLGLKHGLAKSVHLLTGAVAYKHQSFCHGSAH
jgi:hypothetical protein